MPYAAHQVQRIDRITRQKPHSRSQVRLRPPDQWCSSLCGLHEVQNKKAPGWARGSMIFLSMP